MKCNKTRVFALALAALMIQGTTNAYASSKKDTYTKEDLNNMTPGFSVTDKEKSQYKVDSHKNTYSSVTPPTSDDEEDEEELTYDFDQILESQGSQVKNVINTPTSYGNKWAKTEDNQWMYLENGVPAIGWRCVGSDWYYMGDTGIMQTGWLNYGGTWYYLWEDGSMAHNAYVDGYYLTYSGAMA